ncbi:MAG TPA: bifunctional hydroxymethylpyrimidine kinase/phosphomethylpyrimidine kinase [Terriglobales bacterium]|nr:bifunctional hydroxymethylpyrimidine kinase/phosphomethylpyrimidine kinase [Terriglobales bacterium]
MNSPPVVLTVAGFDPSSGAGITADIKTIAAHGCYGVACITALTVQSTTGVRRVEPVDPILLQESLYALREDIEISAVHIGMLGSSAIARVVADFVTAEEMPHVVLDPILASSSGADLIDAEGVIVLKNRLLPLAEIVTPNADEAAALTGMKVANPDQMRAAAEILHSMGPKAVVITGGHFQEATDVLSVMGPGGAEQKTLSSRRLNSNSTHGTGCAFATAIASHLALGKAVAEAVNLAKKYVYDAIENSYPLGKGVGPLNLEGLGGGRSGK